MCRRLEGDGVSECFELFDGVSHRLSRVVSGVAVRPGFAVERAVGEHVPRGDDHCVFDGDEGIHRATSGQPAVLRGEVGLFVRA